MNNTAKHTPGPLKAVQIIIENSPCTWAVQRKSIREQWGKPSVATYIDNEADARLFAAAPAMYEALSVALEQLNACRLGYIDTGKVNIAYQTVKKTLSQAEGK